MARAGPGPGLPAGRTTRLHTESWTTLGCRQHQSRSPCRVAAWWMRRQQQRDPRAGDRRPHQRRFLPSLFALQLEVARVLVSACARDLPRLRRQEQALLLPVLEPSRPWAWLGLASAPGSACRGAHPCPRCPTTRPGRSATPYSRDRTAMQTRRLLTTAATTWSWRSPWSERRPTAASARGHAADSVEYRQGV